jgi:Leucine-rich repeat (LRR) protein
MRESKLQFIDQTNFPQTTNLTDLELTDSPFERIPYAVNKLQLLERLIFQNNKIKTIETPDLAKLHFLTDLYIIDNPIMYIAADAFKENVNLANVILDNTHLNHVPVALTYVTNLSLLRFNGLPIDCTCDMSYLKHWNYPVTTKCAFSSETIGHFITHYLKFCP